MRSIGHPSVDTIGAMLHFNLNEFECKLVGFIMRHVLKIVAAAVTALTFVGGEAQANPLAIGTTMGTFRLGATTAFGDGLGYGPGLTTTVYGGDFISPARTGNVDAAFNLERGSWLDINNGTVPQVGATFLPGALGTLPWFGSVEVAIDYASAFADAVLNNLSGLSAQDDLGFFAPAFPSQDFDSAAYAFAYQVDAKPLPENINDSADVNAIVVRFDGNITPTLSNVALGSTTALVGAGTDGTGSNPPVRALYYAVDPTIRQVKRVPEIDGPVLVQVGFALMGLYVLMLGRRRREGEVDMAQAAA